MARSIKLELAILYLVESSQLYRKCLQNSFSVESHPALVKNAVETPSARNF
jgi:hypothetical protein